MELMTPGGQVFGHCFFFDCNWIGLASSDSWTSNHFYLNIILSSLSRLPNVYYINRVEYSLFLSFLICIVMHALFSLLVLFICTCFAFFLNLSILFIILVFLKGPFYQFY